MHREGTRRIDEILTFNEAFVEQKAYEAYVTTKHPNKKMVVLSCMDTRLTELLPKAMNLRNGDAKIIKNAGATVMHPFGSIIRSIIVAIYEFQAEDVVVVGHHQCGMSHLDSGKLLEKMKGRGIGTETIQTLYHAGIDVERWLHGFESVESAIQESVSMIQNHPLIPKDINVHGLIIDPYTGKLERVVDGYKA
ncbi:MAG: beta-class carbonic anhydrase [Cellulosilyticaceae bacterium]